MAHEINCPRCGNGHCINYTMAGYHDYDASTVPLRINQRPFTELAEPGPNATANMSSETKAIGYYSGEQDQHV